MQFIQEIFNQIVMYFKDLNYMTIFILMTMESSIFPVPSEAVMIPSGYLAKTGSLNLYLVILTGGIGSLFGAIINYFILGRWIGKKFLFKYGKYILITEKKYLKAEKLFEKNDKLYTFLGRFIPVIRHFISIPAGIFKMNFLYFTVLTTLGATIWCSILAYVGYYFGESMVEIFHKYTKEVSVGVIIIFIICFIYFVTKKD
ncbi:DedA family protein [Candidatus Gracilibacteria bacterium]|nr:DedA family protein [Candidatus Gracilibacteria bacterium]